MGKFIKKSLKSEQMTLAFVLIVMCIIATILSPVFLTFNNLMNVLRTASLTAICAMGMVLVILLGEMDLSVGSIQAIIGITGVMILNASGSIVLALLVSLAAGALIGAVNGGLVTGAKIDSIIATLGTMAILRGVSYVVTNGTSLQAKVTSFNVLGTGYLGPFPILLIIAAILFILLNYVLGSTVFGRNIFAVGGNASSAQLCGISVDRIKMQAYIISGILTALSGFILASKLDSAQPNAGTGFEFQVISAVVLGGVSLSGGKGNISGAIIGVLILSVLSNVLVLLGVSSFYQEIARGVVILLAVYMDSRNKRAAAKKRYSPGAERRADYMAEKQEQALLTLANIHKRFPGVHALRGISLDIYPGEVHALMGENGAGKSTLIKVISGVHKPDEGELFLRGEKKVFHGPKEAIENKIRVIYQELSLASNLSVAENIFLGNLPVNSRKKVDFKQLYQKAEKILQELNLDIDVRTKVEYLPIARQQLVEIAKAIAYDPDIIIMDEPTSALSAQEIECLYAIIRMLKEKGKAIVYVSHKLDEIFAVTDKISILRDGEYICTSATADVTEDELIRRMVGRELKDLYVKEETPLGEVVLQVENLETDFVKNISFEVRSGEIVGVSGLMGSGRTEVCRGLMGIDERKGGTVRVNQKILPANAVSKAVQYGIGMIPESRKDDGIFPNLDVRKNMTMAVLKAFRKGTSVDKKFEAAQVEKMIQNIRIKTPSMEQKIIHLSGGNQQKVIVARWLMNQNLKVLIIDEPTRGIDVGAKSEIYALLNDMAKQGLAILVVSSEMPEIIGIADRIYVMKKGEISGLFERGEVSQEKLLLAAT